MLFIAAHLIWNAALFPLDRHRWPELYFYSYWYGRAVLYALECLAVGATLTRLMRPARHLPRSLASAALLLASGICGIGWHFSNSISSQRIMPITNFVLSAERGLATVEAVITIFCILFVSSSAFRWTKREALIVAGFIGHALSSMLSAALFAFLPVSSLPNVRVFVQVASLCVLGLWISAYLRREERNTRFFNR